MKKLIITISILLSAYTFTLAQTQIGGQGVTVPSYTQLQRNALVSPTTGQLIYQTDNTPGFYYWNGTAWTAVSSGGGGGSGDLISTNNLSDLSNTGTARTNLGLGTMSTQAASTVAITGGTINGTSIGATSTSTGAFTTLSASGATTLSSTLGVNSDLTVTKNGTTLGTPFVNFISNDTWQTAMNINNTSTNGRIYSLISAGQNNSSQTPGSFSIYDQTATAYRLVIQPTGKIGIGTVSPSEMLHVAGNGLFTGTVKVGAYTLPSSDGTNGQILATNGSGTLSWTSASSGVSYIQEGAQFTGSLIIGHSTTGALSSATQNTAVGISAMSSITQGDYNTMMGNSAGKNLTTGFENCFLGYNSGYTSTSATQSVGIGALSLYSTTNGASSTAVGYKANYNITSGAQNIAIGREANFGNTAGNHNIGIGYQTNGNLGAAMTSGNNNNVLIGHMAGYSLGDGDDGNVMIGFQAGYNETGANKLYIDNSSTTTPLIWGDFNTNELRIYGTLKVNNAYAFPAGDGSNGQVLTTNGSGTLSWTTVSSGGSGDMLKSDNLSGLTNYTSARTNLGLTIGTNVQAYDADLTTYASITPSANIQSLLGSADYATARTNLGLAIGTNVQAYNANLTTFAGIAPSANIQTLLGSADYATARTNLGLGSIATQAVSSVAITGGTINGTSIGATSTSTGAFTTLAASGATTLSSTLGVTGDLAVNTNKFTVTAASGNTAIAGTLAVAGNTTLTGTLRVGAYTLPNTDGTNGQVLKTNGSGTLAWGAAGGGSTPSFTNSGSNSVSVALTSAWQDITSFTTSSNAIVTITCGGTASSLGRSIAITDGSNNIIAVSINVGNITLPDGTVGVTAVLPGAGTYKVRAIANTLGSVTISSYTIRKAEF